MYQCSFKTDDNIPEPQKEGADSPHIHTVMWTDAVSGKLILVEHKITYDVHKPRTVNLWARSQISLQRGD